jgi:hypothetical protein
MTLPLFSLFLLVVLALAPTFNNNYKVEATGTFRHRTRGSIRKSTRTVQPQARAGKGTSKDDDSSDPPTLTPTPQTPQPSHDSNFFFAPGQIMSMAPSKSTGKGSSAKAPSPGQDSNPGQDSEALLQELGSNDVAPSPPTISPAPTPIHASCQAAQAGEVYATSTSTTIEISYELLTLAGSPLSMLSSILDGRFQEYTARSLVDCSLAAESDIQGIHTAMQSTFTDGDCQQLTGYDETEFFCFVMKSSLEVYLSDTSDMTTKEIQDVVWATLRDAVNGPNSKRRLRMLNEFTSEFVDPDMGIVDLYFLNRPSASFSQANQAQTAPPVNEGLSRPASATLMGFVFVVFGLLGLVYLRKNQRKKDDSMLKATVVTDTGNNTYQNEFHEFHASSPRHKRMEEFDDHMGSGIEVIAPATPSALSCPSIGSLSHDLPPASIFEAYEAAPPTEDGDDPIIVYNYGKQTYPGHLRTQEVAPVDKSDELLDQPPPFLSNIPRSARGRPSSKTHKKSSPRSHQRKQSGERYHLEEPVSRASSSNVNHHRNHRTEPDRIISTSTRQDRISNDLGDDWEVQAFCNTKPPTGDSFSVTGFLNGQCSALEQFHRSEQPQSDLGKNGRSQRGLSNKTRESNVSPTSVMCGEPWMETTKTPQISNKNPLFMTSVDLWTSQCDSGTTEEEVSAQGGGMGMKTAWNYLSKNFSPYGANIDPSLDEICCASPSDVSSIERGRSPTPIEHATNSRQRRSRTASRTPRNPPGHRIKTTSNHHHEKGSSKIKKTSSSQRLRSSSGHGHSSRSRTPSSRRGGSHYPIHAPDTVQF